MIQEKQELLARVLEEISKVEADKAVARRLNAKISRQMDESAMPQVLEYVVKKAEQFDMHREVKNLQRKVEIAEMQLKKVKRTVKSVGPVEMA